MLRIGHLPIEIFTGDWRQIFCGRRTQVEQINYTLYFRWFVVLLLNNPANDRLVLGTQTPQQIALTDTTALS